MMFSLLGSKPERNAVMDAKKCSYSICVAVVGALQLYIGVGGVTVENNTPAILSCPIAQGDYPTWFGPPMVNGVLTIYSNQPSPLFNPDLEADKLRRMTWANNKMDLNFSAVFRTDNGNYKCSWPQQGVSNVELNVRVPPAFPTIYNTTTSSQNELTVSGTESSPLTLTCISVGGYPKQMVNWYRESVTTTPLQAGPPVVVSGDLYNVTRSYTFTPTGSDDGVTYICQSSYNGEPQLIRDTKMKLFLKLRPSTPTVTDQESPTESTSSVNIARCTSSGFRPHNVSLSWTLNGGNAEPVSNPTVEENTATNTFSVSNMFSHAVGRADNGKTLTCSINHETLSSPKMTTVRLVVQFPPKTATLTGEFTTVADGSSKTFSCVSGTSNPDAVITWQRNNVIVTAGTGTPTYTNGGYSGRLTTQTLTITPTRDHDDDIYSCSARNAASNTPANSQQKPLTLTYHPITSAVCQGSPVTERSQVSLSCTTSSKPSSSFTWSHDSTTISNSQGTVASNEFNHVISSVNRTHYGRYTCTASNGISPLGASSCNIEVKFPALNTSITGNPSIVANGANRVTLTCTTGSANPASRITWSVEGQVVNSDEPVQQRDGQYGGKVIYQVLNLTPTRDMDGHEIKCRAGNELSGTSFVEDQVAFDLKYSPVVNATSRTETETQPGLLRCLVSSKPAATLKWYRTDNGHTFLLEGTGDNTLDYNLGTVSRDDAGTYKCTANNGIGGTHSSTVHLIVQYKPDVTIIAQNATENSSSTLRCEPHGKPDSYTYISWEQTWPGSSNVLRTLPGSEVLTLSGLRYEHSGIYTCRVDNGVEFSRNPSAGQGQVFFVVKSRPIMTSDQQTIQKAAQLGNVTTIQVEFVSNSLWNKVNVAKRGNDTVTQSTLFNTTTTSANISVVIFNNTVQTGGFRSEINITVVNQDDFGLYDIVIENDVGIEKTAVNLVPKGSPSPPIIISITHVTETSALLTWIRGFHGGYDQTVKIETRRDGTSWTPTLSLPQGTLVDTLPVNTTITELLPASLYYLRMFSTSAEGDSSKTDMFNFTTNDTGGQDGSPLPLIIGGVVGGTAAAAAIIVITLLLVRKFNWKCQGLKEGSSRLTNDHRLHSLQQKQNDSDGDEEVINPIYDSQGNNETKTPPAENLYAQPNKSKKTGLAINPSDIYAEVKKEKKGKKKTKKNAKQGQDVYENSQPSTSDNNQVHSNEGFDKSEGQTTKKNVNKDGLLYADIVFANPPKGQKRLVIHGLDDMTEYATVDLTKKADPLPDSDEEGAKQ